MKALARFLPLLFMTLAVVAAPEGTFAADGSTAHSVGDELIGTAAPEFVGLQWVNRPALTLHALRGKVVFIRFWFMNCTYCEKSAPTLNYLYSKYAPQGLVVIGIHHPKSSERSVRSPDTVAKAAKQFGFKFPIALDNDWQTVRRYWTDKHPGQATSASFLLDKGGKIVWYHQGGTLALPGRDVQGPNDSPSLSLERHLRALLSEGKR